MKLFTNFEICLLPSKFKNLFRIKFWIKIRLRIRIESRWNVLLLRTRAGKSIWRQDSIFHIFSFLKLTLLNGIKVNGITWLMRSNWPRWTRTKMSLNSILSVGNIIRYLLSLGYRDKLWDGPKWSHDVASIVFYFILFFMNSFWFFVVSYTNSDSCLMWSLWDGKTKLMTFTKR